MRANFTSASKRRRRAASIAAVPPLRVNQISHTRENHLQYAAEARTGSHGLMRATLVIAFLFPRPESTRVINRTPTGKSLRCARSSRLINVNEGSASARAQHRDGTRRRCRCDSAGGPRTRRARSRELMFDVRQLRYRRPAYDEIDLATKAKVSGNAPCAKSRIRGRVVGRRRVDLRNQMGGRAHLTATRWVMSPPPWALGGR